MTDLTEVKGIGPATAVKLHGAGIRTAEALASAEVDHLVQIIGRTTATKIIKNARDLLEDKGVDYDEAVTEELAEEELEEVEPETIEDEEEDEDVDSELKQIDGIGTKTEKDLISAGYSTVDSIANVSVKDLTKVEGVGKVTAETFIANARAVLGLEDEEELESDLEEIEDEDLEAEVEEVVEEDYTEFDEDDDVLDEDDIRTEHERSPTRQGIPTKKKSGVQISKAGSKLDLEALEEAGQEESGWTVKAKELSEEEREARRKRQEMLRAAERITRDIPEPPQPVKAKKEGKQEKGKKPVKKAKQKREVQQQVKKTKAQKKAEKFVDYYSNKDIHSRDIYGRPKGSGESSGESKPRIELDRDTYLGKITSKRRSRRNINNRQVIVKLGNGFNPDALVGQKIYFTYPEGMKVTGSVSKRFGKKSSGKILINFKKGVREEAIFRKVYVY